MSKEDIKEIIALTIKMKRKEMKLTQEQLAVKTNMSRTYIADIEGGRYMPSVETLRNIASVLDIDLGILTEIQNK